VQINPADKTEPVLFIDNKEAMRKLTFVDGTNISLRTTTETGNFLIRLNSRMYNEENANKLGYTRDFDEILQIREDINKLLNGRKRTDLRDKGELCQLDDLEKNEKKLREAMTDVYREDIPSLIIAPTMDMEFAHIGGYNGKFIYQHDREAGQIFYSGCGCFSGSFSENSDDALMFQNWARQISDMEAAVASNPLRLLPLFSYDPRRYRLPNEELPGDNGCEAWNKPFVHILGHSDSASDVDKVWLVFCMNPALGFRPFDELCEHLPRFYSECEKNNIPILAHCAPGGITTHDAKYYSEDLGERVEKSEERHDMMLREGLSSCQKDALSSCMYYGEEPVIDNDYEYEVLDYFYMNYGHPRNWIPVLEYFPDLRLCLSGFGGNSEWQQADWFAGDTELPTRQWIRCIIKMTARYKNVYTDISGLNIYDEKIRNGLLEMLDLVQDEENDEFKHLKHKLIFGSGWYLTYLTDVRDGGTSTYGEDIRHSYSNYCREFKCLFYSADKEGEGKLWEHVSIINPWNFYALSEDDKINKVHKDLSNNTNERIVK
jgi:hypothetical protein